MTHKTVGRRKVLKNGGLLAMLAAAGFAVPKSALAAWNKAAFEGKTVEDAIKAMGGSSPANTADLQIIASDIAENGAVVPIQAVSRLPNTQQIAVLVEKNPNVLAAIFDVGPDIAPDFTTRIKMGQTSNVYVVAKADGKFAMAVKEIKVTLGGCGG
ncbi:thiosulfate oxidation carrier protein SoxY [Halotia wernerae UHCC 0503]|jgi:sulfur-oxidizing protein SoxY|nr:thiosulfate oxidation carrier protein SoxY [Halotia wernerae UHCC 0503]